MMCFTEPVLILGSRAKSDTPFSIIPQKNGIFLHSAFASLGEGYWQ